MDFRYAIQIRIFRFNSYIYILGSGFLDLRRIVTFSYWDVTNREESCTKINLLCVTM